MPTFHDENLEEYSAHHTDVHCSGRDTFGCKPSQPLPPHEQGTRQEDNPDREHSLSSESGMMLLNVCVCVFVCVCVERWVELRSAMPPGMASGVPLYRTYT